jgi:hypothetical protein
MAFKRFDQVLLVAGFALYLLPTWLAVVWRRRQVTAIVVLNLVLGWTALGWAVALVWACMEDRTEKGC